MKFFLLDKVQSITADRIVAVKQVSLAEEYLADHFPSFPVLPGVMMLEAATQAASFVMFHRCNFEKSICVLKDARNVKYGNFVAPGGRLTIDAALIKETPAGGQFKITGEIDGKTAIAARLELALFTLGEKNPDLAHLDAGLIAHNRARWGLIAPTPAAVAV